MNREPFDLSQWQSPRATDLLHRIWQRVASPKFILWSAAVLVILAIVASIVLAEILLPFRKRATEFDLAEVRKVETASVVYDRNENVLGSLFTENRRPVSLQEVPEHLIAALLATEDARFYEHGGVDLVGVVRAVIINFIEGRKAQGASTITQQLARQTFEMREVSYERKLTEMFLARRIEAEYSKSEILQHYLNFIYFGSSFYGVESAAQGYFGKHVSDLSLGESAVLCALIKRPNAYNPFRDTELAAGARNRTLDRMYDLDMITKDEYKAAAAEPVTALDPSLRSGKGLHVMGEIRRRLDEIFKDYVGPRDGIRVYTTIDAELERNVRRGVSEHLANIEAKWAAEGKPPSDQPLEAAVMIIRNDTGELLTSVGGRNFRRSEFDRAFRAKRMMGTAFTPFIYAAAVDNGIDPYEEVLDAPLDNREVMIGALEGIVGEWGAEDAGNEYEGRISAWKAIVSSKNAATVRLGKKLEAEQVLGLVQRAGFTSELRVAPSSILGQTEVTPAELTLAYSSFPNGGTRPQGIVIIRKVLDEKGTVIYQDNSAALPQVEVMRASTAGHVHSALSAALERGTASTSIKELGLSHMPAGGKTGTAYNFTDAWFLGYNSALTCGVWVGHDRPDTVSDDAYGSVMALPIWVDAMNASVESNPPDQIPPPPGTEKVFVCDYTGQAATKFCTEPRLVPKVSPEPIFVSCSHRDYLTPGRIRLLQPCSRHSADSVPAGTEILATTPSGKQIRSAQLMVPAVYPKSLTLVGDDPFGTIITAIVEPPPAAEKPEEPAPAEGGEPTVAKPVVLPAVPIQGAMRAAIGDPTGVPSEVPVARPVVLPPSPGDTTAPAVPAEVIMPPGRPPAGNVPVARPVVIPPDPTAPPVKPPVVIPPGQVGTPPTPPRVLPAAPIE